jgi:ribonuclease T2
MYLEGLSRMFVKFVVAISGFMLMSAIEVHAAEAPTGTSRSIMVFGVSWQPGYCAAKPQAEECLHTSKAEGFALLGLWRLGKTYCGVAADAKALDGKHDWQKLPDIAMDAGVRADLVNAMPGAVSGLDRHEWVKYGTCSGDLADAYFRRSLALLKEINGSQVAALLTSRPGDTLNGSDVRLAFDQAFGAGAGVKVKMQCRKVNGKPVITGLTIGLGETKGNDKMLAALIGEGGEIDVGCASGLVTTPPGQ